MSERRIVGGTAKLTGCLEGGPSSGNRVTGARLREIKGGDNAPHDAYLEFDCTPVDESGKEFGPMPEGATENPEFAGIPTFDGDPSTQALRLLFDYEGDGSCDLAHEYVNHGCTPRIRVKTGPDGKGKISNLRFVAAGGVEIPVRPGSINIGRQ